MNAAQAKLAAGFLHSANKELTAELDRLRASNADLLAVLKLGAAALRYSMAVAPLNDKVYLQTEATEKSMRAAIAKATS